MGFREGIELLVKLKAIQNKDIIEIVIVNLVKIYVIAINFWTRCSNFGSFDLYIITLSFDG